MERSSNYAFRNPFASSICPIPTPDETLSVLHEINESKPSEKRLPTELLLRINKEVHGNAICEEIRATWTPVPGVYRDFNRLGYFGYGNSPLQGRLDLETKRYNPPVKLDYSQLDPADFMKYLPTFDGTSVEELYCHISSADLLYRLRCYFPEITIDSDLDHYKVAWEAFIRHNETGMLLSFSDFKAAASLKVHYDKESKYQRNVESDTKKMLEDAFSVDALRLLNALFETVDGSRRMSFYHPAANADIPTDNDRYIAVPHDYAQDRCSEVEDPSGVYDKWNPTTVSASDVSSFRSILQDLKYNISSRKIDRADGAAPLTTVISSPLLFYRLICKFMLGHNHTSVIQSPPITSVWQIQLVHEPTKGSVIFMDDRGLFDIRADEKVEEMMPDIVALVELLCGDSCTHSYDDVLTGCVA